MRLALFLSLVLLAFPAAAEVLTAKEARAALFSTRGYETRVSGALSQRDRATVQALVPLIARQLNQPVRYYASIAYSPKDGLVHEALQGALNYHSPESADAAAIRACNKLRSRGAPACRLAARVVPKGYAPRPLTLSVDATAAFERTYRRMRGPKAFAISRATGAWGVGESDAAAIRACRVQDCEIVIRD